MVLIETNYWLKVGCDITVNIIADVLFLYLVFNFIKPKLRISPYITETIEASVPVFKVKFYNKDWFFKSCDIEILLTECRIISNGKDVSKKDYQLTNGYVPILDSELAGKKSKSNDHACKIKIREPLRVFLNEQNHYIEMCVKAKHQLSGITKVFYQRFDLDSIKGRDFKQGSNIEVIV